MPVPVALPSPAEFVTQATDFLWPEVWKFAKYLVGFGAAIWLVKGLNK